MKVAVVKLGARIAFGSSSSAGSVGEAQAICNMLRLGGADVHIYTKILDKDEPAPEGVTLHQIEEEFDDVSADALVVINGNVNFFGGVLDNAQILNYHILNRFNGPVHYILCDPAITLKQIWSSVASKDKDSLYKRENIEVTRTDIHYICQPYNTAKYLQFVNKSKSAIGISRMDHYPFEKFPCLQTPLSINPMPLTDLSYGGTFRGGRRAGKMLKFYFGYSEDIEVEIFGKIKREDFDLVTPRPPTFSGPVKYEQMMGKMNKSLAHVVIGDKLYEDTDDVPQRLAESVWSQVVTFVDHDMDRARRIFGKDKYLNELLYVTDNVDVEAKIMILKDDDGARREVLEYQMAAFNFDAADFCNNFVELLRRST